MTTDQTGKTLIFDPWNRLIQVKNGATVLETYAYDPLNRRITENPGTLKDLFYSSQWQVLEERTGSTVQIQYVWSPVYVDALLERDRDADANPANGLEERLYVQQDANWNVSAITSSAGTVLERYVQDAYGSPTILAPDWTTRATSSYAWIYLHQGGRFEIITGLYNFRHRDYSATLGRWLQLDPIGYRGGDNNFYRHLSNSPSNIIDPQGLATEPIPIPVGDILQLVYDHAVYEVGKTANKKTVKRLLTRYIDIQANLTYNLQKGRWRTGAFKVTGNVIKDQLEITGKNIEEWENRTRKKLKEENYTNIDFKVKAYVLWRLQGCYIQPTDPQHSGLVFVPNGKAEATIVVKDVVTGKALREGILRSR